MHVVRHQVPLYDLDPLPLAQLPENLPQVLAVLVVDDLPSILWCEHDVVLAEPLRVRKAVGLLGHGNHLPLGAGDLNNHHARGEGISLHSTKYCPPAQRVVFYAARTARHGLKSMKKRPQANLGSHKILEPAEGVEPTTHGLQNRCSAIEPCRRTCT